MTNKIRTLSIATILLGLAACAAGTAAAPGVGVWDVSTTTPVGDQAGVWTINADGTGIMGEEVTTGPSFRELCALQAAKCRSILLSWNYSIRDLLTEDSF